MGLRETENSLETSVTASTLAGTNTLRRRNLTREPLSLTRAVPHRWEFWDLWYMSRWEEIHTSLTHCLDTHLVKKRCFPDLEPTSVLSSLLRQLSLVPNSYS